MCLEGGLIRIDRQKAPSLTCRLHNWLLGPLDVFTQSRPHTTCKVNHDIKWLILPFLHIQRRHLFVIYRFVTANRLLFQTHCIHSNPRNVRCSLQSDSLAQMAAHTSTGPVYQHSIAFLNGIRQNHSHRPTRHESRRIVRRNIIWNSIANGRTDQGVLPQHSHGLINESGGHSIAHAKAVLPLLPALLLFVFLAFVRHGHHNAADIPAGRVRKGRRALELPRHAAQDTGVSRGECHGKDSEQHGVVEFGGRGVLAEAGGGDIVLDGEEFVEVGAVVGDLGGPHELGEGECSGR
mmetsp:Transcript_12955/g.27375  ORF Transcript_12955/g.27375 Transcript_12955/m.27375 type:complete len:293 (-) Transcript_12955:41-919(-)